MTVTLAQLKEKMKLGVQRTDLETGISGSTYTDFINEALDEIQRDRSWNGMKKVGTVTVTSGTKSVSLSGLTNFKELQTVRTPIHFVASDGVLIPCDVWTREKLLRRGAMNIFNTALLRPSTANKVAIPVYLDFSTSPPTLSLFDNVTENINFSVAYFGFLSALAADGDNNVFTNEHPEMVLAKAKAIAFGSVNDPEAERQEAIYQFKFRRASAKDSYAALAGLDLRM